MLFCCLWRNVETSCHKHFVVVSCYKQTPPLRLLPAISVTACGTVVSESRFLSTPPRGFLSEYCHACWYGETTLWGKKIAPLYFWNNFVKPHYILIIFGLYCSKFATELQNNFLPLLMGVLITLPSEI